MRLPNKRARLETSERLGENLMKPKERKKFFQDKMIYRKLSIHSIEEDTSGVAYKKE